MDQTFQNDPGFRLDRVFYGDGLLFRRCRENAECRALYRQKAQEAVDRATALLLGDFPAFARELAAHHVDTFSRERLESDLDSVPARTEDALAYLRARVETLRRDIACDEQSSGTPCTVADDFGNTAFEGLCTDGEGRSGLSCLPQ